MAEGAAWLQRGPLWCLEPPAPARSGPGGPDRLEFIGGSYLAATPQLSYRRLLEAFSLQGWSVRAWSYVPAFDHQSQANEAWRSLRRDRQQEQDAGRAGSRVLRLGHSLGCKLHLLAPDGGRGCGALAALSFNNFSAERSVPLLAEMGQQFGFRSEFSPSPQETLRQVAAEYQQPRNLLVRFRRDELDQSPRLLEALHQRHQDASELLELPGDHLTPASAGLRRQLLGTWADDPSRQRQIERLVETISRWGRDSLPG
ncbi:MAG: DUF1350 family protein [Synechococcaceae cyanobacterium ELA739]|jgi:hypothetical protein